MPQDTRAQGLQLPHTPHNCEEELISLSGAGLYWHRRARRTCESRAVQWKFLHSWARSLSLPSSTVIPNPERPQVLGMSSM